MAGKKGMKHLNKRVAKPQMLLDAEHVYNTDEGEGDTPSQKSLRVEKDASTSKFLDRMTRLEEAWLTAKGPTPVEGEAVAVPLEQDEGTERLKDVLRDWLERHR